jgi:diguanylate cyclase (GGDEF)-like protein/PAS domain S-box-containing protein
MVIGGDGALLYTNPEFSNITGYLPEEIATGSAWLSRAYPDPEYRRQVIRFWKEDVTHKGIDRQFRVTCKDGTTKIIDFRPFLLDDGKSATILSDVTEHMKAEEALRQSEEKFRALFEDSRDAIFINRTDGTFVDVNRAFLKLFGCTREDLARLKASDTYFNPAERSHFQEEMAAHGSVRDFEVILKKTDGAAMDCLLTATVRRSPDGAIAGYQGIIRDISAQRRMEETLRQSEARYHAIFDTTGTATVIVDDNTVIAMANKEFEALSGCNREELEGKRSFSEFVDKDDLRRLMEYHEIRKINPAVAPRNYEFTFIDRFGTPKSLFATIAILPGTRMTIGSFLDMTEQKRFQDALAASHRTMRDIIENAPLGVLVINRAGAVEFVNPAMLNISGATRDQFLSLNVFHLSNYQRLGLTEKIRKAFEGQHFRLDAVEYTSHFGKRTTIRNFIGMPYMESGEPKVLMFVEDITKQKFNELQLSYLATHDTLTGLPNRTLFYDRLKIAVATATRYGQRLAVMLFDLDKFKEVNDTLGHKVGDELLKSVGERATVILRQSDTLARMGGDEFLVLLPTIAQTSDADLVARKLLDTFQRPFTVEGRDLLVTTSIGVSVFPDDGTDSDALVKYADIAMYEAKQGGRNGYRRYRPQGL